MQQSIVDPAYSSGGTDPVVAEVYQLTTHHEPHLDSAPSPDQSARGGIDSVSETRSRNSSRGHVEETRIRANSANTRPANTATHVVDEAVISDISGFSEGSSALGPETVSPPAGGDNPAAAYAHVNNSAALEVVPTFSKRNLNLDSVVSAP
eukprot:gb/GEZN01013989.1/.p1 GENE.gb/GEZN01013989.1/~~gb/GEZN01013989.1/.p1  ORF type:complete len:151 (+),score=15.96 gb/GEZN01013989.1/:235-687(+)